MATQRQIPIPRPLTLTTGNLSTNWRVFKRDWGNYEIASKLSEEDDKVRVATFLSCIGREAMDVYDGFQLDGDENDLETIMKAFEKYCIGETNESYERFVFNSRNQRDDETVDKYVSELRKLAKTCNFGPLEESLIRDKIITGIKCDMTRRKLLQESKLDLQKSIDISRSIEASKKQIQTMQGETKDSELHKVGMSSRRFRAAGAPTASAKDPESKPLMKKECHYCGRQHPFKKEACPAWGKICSFCKGRNHFSSKCKKRVHALQTETTCSEDEETLCDDVWLAAINNNKKRNRTSALLQVNEQEVRFQLDTAADINTICQRYVRKDQVRPTNQRLVMWNKTTISPKGEATLKVFNPKTRTSHNITFTVVPNQYTCLLGLDTVKELSFVSINENKFIAKMDVGADLGDLGEAKLTIDPTKKPRQLPARKIPFSLKDTVKAELKHLVDRGILKPVDEPTEWVSQMAIAEKPNGDIRICIDPSPLNEALQREHYRLPTLDDVLVELKDARIFSKFDVKEAFWSIRLDEESSLLTTMITEFGRFRWLRLPFGLKVSSEIFQKKISHALEGLRNTINVADDIMIAGCGKNDEEAKQNLNIRTKELKQRCQDKNIILNDKKTITQQKEIVFMGHLITSEGISPDPAKVEAIQSLPTPTDVSAVRRLCGTIQYLARYIPNLSQHLEPLRALTRQNAEWNWSPECQQAFETVKSLVVEHTKLSYFDNNKELCLQVDSSKDGVGVALMQEGRPIEFASRSLTTCQRRWAQIEKELLAVIIGLERFDQYTYGRKVYVQNDHQPLANILKKPLSEAPRRLQNLLMRLHRYDCEFQYTKGSHLYIADTLSRAVGTDVAHVIPEMKINSVSSISDSMMTRIREETKRDPQLQVLTNYIIEGWPTQKKCDPQVIPFQQVKDQLSVEHDILYKGEQVIIPKAMRAETKQKLHAAHLGYDSMIRRVSTTIFWPGIRQEVKQMADQCETCQIHKPANPKETLKLHEEGTSPWEKIGADLFEIDGQNYLVVVDYLTNYIEIDLLTTTTTSQIIKKLKLMFTRWGIPCQIMTDCGPQLTSSEFKDFLQEWGIEQKKSSPHHHQSNGKAESAVKIMKNMIKKCRESNSDTFKALLEQRNTPRQDTNKSPAEMMLGRQPRTLLPTKKSFAISPDIQDCRTQRRESIKKSFDRSANDLKDIPVNSPVYYRTPQNTWKGGKVIQKNFNSREYTILSENGTTYVRNRIHIRPKNTPFDDTYEAVLTYTNNGQENDGPNPNQNASPTPSNRRRPNRERKQPTWMKDYYTM